MKNLRIVFAAAALIFSCLTGNPAASGSSANLALSETPQRYALTVENGTGDGSYAAGEKVTITADAAPASTGSLPAKSFFRWAWGGENIASARTATTTITMPAAPLTVTATYRTAGTMGTYGVKINSGSGSGFYTAGSRVEVKADTAPSGKVFDKWTGDTDAIFGRTLSFTGSGDVSVSQPAITVFVPYDDVILTATYKDASATTPATKYKLTVNKGEGTGEYEAGKKIEISANMTIAEIVFDKWTGDVQYLENANAFTTFVTMPAKSITVTATYRNSPALYNVTVNSGTGDGKYIVGEKVTIKADAAPSGKAFYKWTGDTACLSDASASTATVTVPAKDVTLTATYKDVSTAAHTLTVNGGTGSGKYIAGEKVSITADAPLAGKIFDKWTGDTSYVMNTFLRKTLVTMPEKDIALTATYRDAAATSYRLKVNGGTGEGNYAAGTEVAITANAAPEGKVFMKWAGDTQYLADAQAASTKVTMPGRNIVITAVYKGKSSDTVTMPDGTLIKLPESPKIYVIIDGEKKWISTPEVFEQLGFDWKEITNVTDGLLQAIEDLEDNLIRIMGDPKVYLVVNGVKRHIPNPEVFGDYGFSWSDIKDVDKDAAQKYKETYLVRQSGDDKVYYLSPEGVRKHIPTAEIFNSYGDKWEDIQVVSKKEMENYPLTNLISPEGSNKVYLVEGNVKKLIPDAQTFNKKGFDWGQILKVNKAEFDWYKDGGAVK